MLQKELFKYRDEEYKIFTSKLIPTVDEDLIIGVRMPILRKLAKNLKDSKKIYTFLNSLPHKYYEENNLHILLVDKMKDKNQKLKYIDKFLPFVDNWSTADLILTINLAKEEQTLFSYIEKWIKAKDTYSVRCAIGMLMRNFQGKFYSPKILSMVENISSNEYYINMMRAWFFAENLQSNPKDTINLISKKTLDKFTQNKAIQKSIESRKIPDNIKKEIRLYRIE